MKSSICLLVQISLIKNRLNADSNFVYNASYNLFITATSRTSENDFEHGKSNASLRYSLSKSIAAVFNNIQSFFIQS